MGDTGSKSAEEWEIISDALKNEELRPEDNLWSLLWDLDNVEDLWFMQFSYRFVSDLKQSNPSNFCLLLKQIVNELAAVVNDPSDEPINFQEQTACMNCVRILTRLIPVILESGPEGDEISDFLWNADGEAAGDQATPVAARIVRLLTDCLFLPGLTISKPRATQEIDGINCERLWATGFGIDSGIYLASSTIEYDQNRTEIIKCLITCFSTGLFTAADEYTHEYNPWLSVMVNPGQNPGAKTLFYSLINTIVHYDPSTVLPYTYALSTDSAEPLVDAALQLLLILIDFRELPVDESDAKTEEKSGAVVQSPEQEQPRRRSEAFPNVFRECLFLLPTNKDLAKLYFALARLLNIGHLANNTYLPNSMKEIGCYQELFVLLWKLLDESESFYQFVLNADVEKIVIPVLYFMYVYRTDQARTGLIHTCTFILLKLSGEREFGIALNTPFTTKLPLRDLPNFQGTLADLLIIVTHKLIINSPQHVDSLFHVLLTVLANISPYITRMCLVSSVKLLNLLELFSSPKFLYAAENHHQYLFFLLDVFNNIIQYQSHGNSRLIYAITNRKETFYRLGRIPNTKKPSQPQHQNPVADNVEMKHNVPTPTSHSETKSAETPNGTAGAAPSVQAEAGQIESVSSESSEKQDEPPPNNESDGAAGADGTDEAPSDVVVNIHPTKPGENVPNVSEALPGDQSLSQQQPPQGGQPHAEPDQQDASEQQQAKFVPNPEWIISWKKKLPLEAIYRLLEYLVPKMETLCSIGTVDESHILKYLEETTLVGILPVPHHIVIRRYRPSTYTALWFTTYIWGVIFLRNQLFPLFEGDAIKMFSINTIREEDYDSEYSSDEELAMLPRDRREHQAAADQNKFQEPQQHSQAATSSVAGSVSVAEQSEQQQAVQQVVASKQSRAIPALSEHHEKIGGVPVGGPSSLAHDVGPESVSAAESDVSAEAGDSDVPKSGSHGIGIGVGIDADSSDRSVAISVEDRAH